ncbi:nuclear transport factor 2 family protein [Pseudomonas chlororaphis]|jgi:ketosteroid isomerase-like protein|uniref:nuclear transport factor 2 family protein n=1 Tax=Pseudomonas chlororaphis TaxID=587753 RepID=UPI0015DF3AD6|nr:nuclear transport factor 2 family protein [Pseudomonas chlororaphis]QLL12569.1 nuclear transport factor 2 family protein [Pseudomonas chlororaphis subsp. aurantiaca]
MKSIWAFGFAGLLGSLPLSSYAGSAVPYPDIADISHAEPETARLFKSFFAFKSQKNIDKTMAYFSSRLLTYTDATFGWNQDSPDAIRKVLPHAGQGISYPTRILGGSIRGAGSAVVEFTDTPELFGGELRIVGAVDFKDGKIIRWIDYWDSSSYNEERYHQFRKSEDQFPTDFKESGIPQNASKRIHDISRRLQSALAKGDAPTAAALFSNDAVFEDLAVRTQIRGQAAIERYFDRIRSAAPYAMESRLRHIVGSDLGGGFEWYGRASTGVTTGIMALTLDQNGKISRAASMYDGRLLGKSKASDLRSLAAEL